MSIRKEMKKTKDTILAYLDEYGDCGFDKRPFGPVDSLILSQFSYLKFDKLVPVLGSGKRKVCLEKLLTHKDYETLYADVRYAVPNRSLFEKMAAGKRFGQMELAHYVNIVDPEWQTQFSAITCYTKDGPVYVAYRGTDETLTGWREDCNLAYPRPVPGQIMSVEYLNEVGRKLRGEFLVGGHSKGGNLAEYAAMCCKKSIQNRIRLVYNHDGPGLHPVLMQNGNHEKIQPRIHKTIPYASVIGLLLQSDDAYKVVESNNVGILQHDPYSWLTINGEFAYLDEVRAGNLFIDRALSEWIMSLEDAQKDVFIEALFEVLEATGTDNVIDLVTDWKKSMHIMAAAMKELDADTKRVISQILTALYERAGEDARAQAEELFLNRKDGLFSKFEIQNKKFKKFKKRC